MTSLTIRKLAPEVKNRLRLRAARHGRSMEEEVRRILSAACGAEGRPESLADVARRLFGPEQGVELDLPKRAPGRAAPRFDG